MPDTPEIKVVVGDIELGLTDGSWSTSIRDLARADLTVDLTVPAPDWWAGLELRAQGEIAFRGSVLVAEPVGDGMHVSAASGVEMTEHMMGIVAAEDFPVQDMVYAAASAAGFSRDRMVIQGLDELPFEPFEIVAPLRGVVVERRLEMGNVVLLPHAVGRKALEFFHDVPEEFGAAWNQADAFALTIADGRLLAEVEARGIEAIDAAVAWLVVRARYGYARLPDGTRSQFDRVRARTLPLRRGPSAVRGLATNRRWLRDPEGAAVRDQLKLPGGDLAWPQLDGRLTTADRFALLAARDAAMSRDLVERATAISTAWEFYCADASPPALFDGEEVARLKDQLPGWLADEQRRRMEEILGMANQFSLARRLRTALELDAVPITAGEWRTLQRVRKVRNRAVHGSEALATSADDLDLSCSVLARALVYRMARREALRQQS